MIAKMIKFQHWKNSVSTFFFVLSLIIPLPSLYILFSFGFESCQTCKSSSITNLVSLYFISYIFLLNLHRKKDYLRLIKPSFVLSMFLTCLCYLRNIHQSKVLIFHEKSVFFSSQSPKLTN